MQLTTPQREAFEREGYLFLPGLFSPAEVKTLTDAVPALYAKRDAFNVREKGSDAVRTNFTAHLVSDPFARLARHPRMIEPVQALLAEPLYMHQFKVNGKMAFEGDVWQWHQDYGTWKNDDWMPTERAMNVAIFINDVNEFNGPLMFIPGSHRKGVIDAKHDVTTTSYPLWTVDHELIGKLVERAGGKQGGIVSPQGPVGSMILFHSCLVHASSSNLSPWNRVSVYLSLCAVSNHIRRFKRPEFIAHRDFTPIDCLPDDCLWKDYPVVVPWKAWHAGQRARHVRGAGGLCAARRMSLYAQLQRRTAEGKPIRAGLIGAGKFGSMYLAQVPRTPGVHLVAIADLNPAGAKANLARVGWSPEQSAAISAQVALRDGNTWITDDWQALVKLPEIDIVVECTGSPVHAVDHILAATAEHKHVVNVTVEADAFCGPLLARRAAEAGVIYSLAYGDQPAMICDLVDWARTCGFPVVAAGRGHKWLPRFCRSTPKTVWGHYGLTPEQAERGGLNPKMFNSFLDGSKPSIESTAVANATGLAVPSDGLQYPPASVEDIPRITRPVSEVGVLERKGMVEVISSLERDGRVIPYDIRMGVWVTVEAETEYVKNCFEEYNAHTDDTGRYFTLYKRWHLIGLEVGLSVASVALRGEPTGVAQGWIADVVATAKRDLKPGEMLDGEGGYTVWGKLLPAATSRRIGGLPLGLAHDVKLVRAVKQGQSLSWDYLQMPGSRALEVRREMERVFSA